MRKYFGPFYCSIFIFFLSGFTFIFAQQTDIGSITNNPYGFNGNVVEIDGLVTQYIFSSASSNYYILKSDFGGSIKVNTADSAPETNLKYHVKGIVYYNLANKDLFITEITRHKFGEIIPTQSKTKPSTIFDPPQVYNLIMVIIFLLVLLGMLFIFFLNKREKPEAASPLGSIYRQQYQPQINQGFFPESDFSTTRVAVASPKTLRFIPGQMIITDGEDKGRAFRISGYQTAGGTIVTIGRREVSGDRAYSHIQLKGHTISREHAELIYKEGKLYVRNLSKTNLTQLEGFELGVGEIAELKPECKIRTGEVEFQYKL